MKIIEGFRLREVMGMPVVVGEGTKQINFNKLISLNDSAALLWHKAEGHDFTIDDMAKVLIAEYDVDAETAQADAAAMVQQWIEAGLVEE